MSGNVENLVLEQLRRMNARFDNLEGDLRELKTRVTALDEHMGGVMIAVSGMNARLDRFDERLARVERRLDLTDAL
ncbi:hypothetical protein [Sphingomonas sp. ID0503]|uniref:hypothetical protein n=1 Tax=Sphingomonas sp. ID0503 TaxID=3399691 RepID=UPI003AFA2F83